MAKTEVYTCDVCGAQKRESNHWWRVKVGTDKEYPYASVRSWDLDWKDEHVEGPELHCCGQVCVVKKVSEVMEGK